MKCLQRSFSVYAFNLMRYFTGIGAQCYFYHHLLSSNMLHFSFLTIHGYVYFSYNLRIRCMCAYMNESVLALVIRSYSVMHIGTLSLCVEFSFRIRRKVSTKTYFFILPNIIVN